MRIEHKEAEKSGCDRLAIIGWLYTTASAKFVNKKYIEALDLYQEMHNVILIWLVDQDEDEPEEHKDLV